MPMRPHLAAPERTTALLQAAATEHGFDRFAMVVWVPYPAAHPFAYVASNFPAEWLMLYRERGYAAIDPVARWCKAHTGPLVWSDEVLAQAPAFSDEAAAFGLRYGWSQAVHDGLGVRGILNLARAAPPLQADELRSKRAQLHVLAHSTHRLVVTGLRAQWASAVAEPLTGREVEVLRWAADGKTAQDTAEILNVKLSTARFHIDKAVRKLSAENVAAAVFRALVMGMLHGLPEPAAAATPPKG